MDWTRPPTCYEDLCIWKVFVMTYTEDVWQIIRRWIKRYGNPFEEPVEESVEEQQLRHVYQDALRFCYIKR